MEEKESTVSGSPGNSEAESPPVSGVVPQVMNMAINMSMERSLIGGGGGGGSSGGGGGGGDGVVSGGGGGSIVSVGGGSSGSFDLLGRKKRGRPRKYDADGNLRLSYAVTPPPGFSLSSPSSEFSSKRGRGRPPGSGNWQLLASLGELFANTAGGDFTPHVVTVNTGEDVASKILSFSHKGPRGICVLSANGAVSNVTIRQPGSSGGILTYEGRFEILSLSGSFTVADTGGVRSRTGGLSVSLAGPDGRVIGGGIAGILTAAGPIQIVVGSFMPNGYKTHKRKHHRESMTSSIIATAQDSVTAARPISQAAPEGDTCLNPRSPSHGQSHGEADDTMSNKQLLNVIPSQSAAWNCSERTSEQRPSPDINLTVPSE